MSNPCSDLDLRTIREQACEILKCKAVRRQYFGLISRAGQDGVQANGTIAAGATASVVTATQKPAVPERLVAVSDTAIFFDILNIASGAENQSIVPDVAAPGSMFSEIAVDAWVRFDPMQVSQNFTARVSNRDGQEHPFRGGVFAWTTLF